MLQIVVDGFPYSSGTRLKFSNFHLIFFLIGGRQSEGKNGKSGTHPSRTYLSRKGVSGDCGGWLRRFEFERIWIVSKKLTQLRATTMFQKLLFRLFVSLWEEINAASSLRTSDGIQETVFESDNVDAVQGATYSENH